MRSFTIDLSGHKLCQVELYYSSNQVERYFVTGERFKMRLQNNWPLIRGRDGHLGNVKWQLVPGHYEYVALFDEVKRELVRAIKDHEGLFHGK